MAIKKRERPAVDQAAIESFGDAAELAETNPEKGAASRSEPLPLKRENVGEVDWPDGVSRQFLLRFPDPAIPVEVGELQQLLGRNKHQTILLALRRGLDVLRAEVNELGERADLLK